MKLSIDKENLKIERLKVRSFITNLDEEVKDIRGGAPIKDYTRGFCPSTHSFAGCLSSECA